MNRRFKRALDSIANPKQAPSKMLAAGAIMILAFR